MRNFLITAAALATFATLASAPASALDNYGPTKQGNECFTSNVGREMTFGVWGACPKPASVAPAPKSKKK
jgi:hypothetical protein